MRRHVPGDVAADLLQETAARLVASRTDVKTVDELAAWAYTVASRLTIDEARRRRVTTVPLVLLADIEDIEGGPDPASIAEGRADWDRVMAAVRRLSPGDRAAILSAFETAPPTRVEAVRWAVRRHRARVRLIALLGELGAVVGAVGSGMRRLWRTRPSVVALVAAPIVALVVIVLPFATRLPEVPLSEADATPVAQMAGGQPMLVAAVPRHHVDSPVSTARGADTGGTPAPPNKLRLSLPDLPPEPSPPTPQFFLKTGVVPASVQHEVENSVQDALGSVPLPDSQLSHVDR